MQTLGWSMGRIKANIEGTYHKDQVMQAANAIHVLANSCSGALFLPCTETGNCWHDTNASQSFFNNPAQMKGARAACGEEANDLAEVASNGDVAAVKALFGNLGRPTRVVATTSSAMKI